MTTRLIYGLALVLSGVACSGGTASTSEGDKGPTLSAASITDGLLAHRPAVTGTNGLITSGHPLASMAGMQILMQGGTAADAAVAVLATLNLVEPMMSGAGGNGFFTVYDAETGDVLSLNATGAAPRALDAREVTADELHRGMKAGVVPGLLGGWIALLDRFGTMSLREVLDPAIRYAERGHPVAPFVAKLDRDRSRAVRSIRDHGCSVSSRTASRPRRGRSSAIPIWRGHSISWSRRRTRRAPRALRAGGSFRRPSIASTKATSHATWPATTNAPVGSSPVPTSPATSRSGPSRSARRIADTRSTRAPATSRGGLEVAMQLNLVEGYDLASMGHNSASTLHVLVEAIKVAKADVYHYVADPAVADVPTDGLVAKSFADTRRALIAAHPGRAMAYPAHGTPPGAPAAGATPLPVAAHAGVRSERSYTGSTTSFSVVDRAGKRRCRHANAREPVGHRGRRG